MKICSKKECIKIGDYKMSNGTSYCGEHYGFKRMQHKSQKSGQYISSNKELKQLLNNLDSELICPNCKQNMVWHNKKGKVGNSISLQHNNDGTIQFICHLCNVGHGRSQLGDKYFDLKNNEKYCPTCNKTLYKDDFYKTKNNKNGLCTECKACRKIRNRNIH